ncbi:MAG: alanine racemase [Burkholderiales bacterium]|nr:alanine racemase [Burkholderiales bacterium]
MNSVAPATLTIDAGAIAANWRLLAASTPSAECAAAVKADAYGTGVEAAVPALVRAGCRTFFAAHVEEGRQVRAYAPAATIYILNGLLPGSAGLFPADRLRPVLGSVEEIAEWSAFVAATGAPGEAAVHVDTGMNRLGLPLAAAKALGKARDDLSFRPSLLMSHFVASETPRSPITARQLSAFAEVRAWFPGIPGSLANSSGIFLGEAAHHDMVRPGYALYGGNPLVERPNPMRPVVALHARIVQVRDIDAGETVGYNAQWTARGPRRLATVSVGYADGYPRSGSARDGHAGGEAMVGGVRCPFAGRISMDLIVVDVTEAPADAVQRGAAVALIDDTLTIDLVGERAGSIGYEILTRLGRRYARTIVEG